jgi:outer membrane protein assembly factor BamA
LIKRIVIMGALSGIALFMGLAAFSQHNGLQKKIIPSKGDIHSDGFLSKVDAQLVRYQKKGYLECWVDTIVEKPKKAMVYFVLGPQYQLNSIFRLGTQHDTLESIVYARPKAFSIARYQTILTNSLNTYANNGYPYAQLLNLTTYCQNLVDVKLEVRPGWYIMFDTLKVMPQSVVNSIYVQGISGIKPGQPYNQQLVSNITKVLNNNGFMIVDSVRAEYDNGQACVVKIYSTPISSSRFDGFIGFQQNQQGNNQITGQLNLKLVNSLRFGELFELNWQKPGANYQYLNLDADWPIVMNWPLGVAGNLNIDHRDTLFTNAVYRIGVTSYWQNLHRVGIFYGNFQGQSADTNIASNMVSLTLSYLNPHILSSLATGYGYNITGCIGSKQYSFNGGSATNRSLFKLESAIKGQYNWQKQAVFAGLSGGIYPSQKLARAELYQIGGINTFRGVSDRSVFCKDYLYANFEYRFGFSQQSFALLFTDAGLFNIPDSTNYNNNMKVSTGFGVVVDTPAGELKLNYAMPVEQNELNVRRAKIHIGYSIIF